MKKRLFLLLCPALLLGLLTGCHLFQVMDGPGMEYHGEETEPAEDPKPDAPEIETGNVQEADKVVAGNDAEMDGGGAVYLLSDYLSVERTETPCGAIEMPRLDLEKLPGGDARLADQMFCAIRDRLTLLAEECQKEADACGGSLETDEPVCETRACLSDDILSVLIRYEEPNFYASPITEYEGVVLDVRTGEAIPASRLLDVAGFTREESEVTVRAYVERGLTIQWESMVYWTFADEKRLPDGLGDPSYGWQEELDDIVRELWMEQQGTGEAWDALERYPTAFYEGGDKLSLCTRVSTAAGAGYAFAMVELGHDVADVYERNPLDCWGEPFGRFAMLTDDAYYAAANATGMEPEDFLPVSMDFVPDRETGGAAYLLETLDGGRFAVGVFSGTVWEEQDGDWQVIPTDT